MVSELARVPAGKATSVCASLAREGLRNLAHSVVVVVVVLKVLE